MKANRIQLLCAVAFAIAAPMLMVGCEREVSHSGSTSVKRDGSTKSQETVVRQSPDGTITKDETSSKTARDGETVSKTTTTVKSPDGSTAKEQTKTTTTP